MAPKVAAPPVGQGGIAQDIFSGEALAQQAAMPISGGARFMTANPIPRYVAPGADYAERGGVAPQGPAGLGVATAGAVSSMGGGGFNKQAMNKQAMGGGGFGGGGFGNMAGAMGGGGFNKQAMGGGGGGFGGGGFAPAAGNMAGMLAGQFGAPAKKPQPAAGGFDMGGGGGGFDMGDY
jgi:hypothetical protein